MTPEKANKNKTEEGEYEEKLDKFMAMKTAFDELIGLRDPLERNDALEKKMEIIHNKLCELAFQMMNIASNKETVSAVNRYFDTLMLYPDYAYRNIPSVPQKKKIPDHTAKLVLADDNQKVTTLVISGA